MAVVPEGYDGESRTLFHFGAYGDTHVLVLGCPALDEALDAAIDYLVDHAPGLLCDEYVREEYERGISEGLSEEDAQERAEIDTTSGGNCGNHISSSEWHVTENPSRAFILECQGRSSELRTKGKDLLASRKPGNVARRAIKRAA